MKYINSRAISILAGIICSVSSLSLVASDFGTTGLIDLPTSRMLDDGALALTAAPQSSTKSYSLTYQATPWLQTTFRYTGFNDFFGWDRNYEIKVRVIDENKFVPNVSVGIRDLVGTGVWSSEYIVASKKLGRFDLSIGAGWGRLAGDGVSKNPLRYISDDFMDRRSGDRFGGKVASKTFFRGKNIGLFGGLSYKFKRAPLTLLMEYNPDNFVYEVANGGYSPESKLSAGLKWDISNKTTITLSHQHGREVGLNLSTSLNTKAYSFENRIPYYRSSLDIKTEEIPSWLNKKSWYDMLLFDAERSGLFLFEGTLSDKKDIATLVMGNKTYLFWRNALEVMLRLANLHLPDAVKVINLVVQEKGHKLHVVHLDRAQLSSQTVYTTKNIAANISSVRFPEVPQHRTDFFQKQMFFDINLATRFQFFDPTDPARYQLYLKLGLGLQLPKSWTLRGVYGFDLINNFDESTRVSDSVLPHVRTDVVKYLVEGDTGLDALYFEKRGDLAKALHFRVFGGILESMYSGVGGELLYQPHRSRLAYGLSMNKVLQRNFEKDFRHLDYSTTTVFASMYWALPFHNYDLAFHLGRYLAKDKGATIELRRTFKNGWMVGAWATKTDVSSAEFGEGSFDKGLFFRVPIASIMKSNKRNLYSTRLRPIQRDGGQRLEDFSGTIWWDLRTARIDSF